MINVALVGFGLSGRYLQAPFFEANQNFNLMGIVTSQLIPREIFPSAQSYSDFDQVIEDKDITLVSISSPNSTHYEYAKRALQAGKNVLVEKPVTATLKQAKELFSLAKEKKLHLFVFQNRRFDSDFRTIQSLLDFGALGEIFSYEAHFDRYKPNLNTKAWKERPADANGILYDLGSHLIDQAIVLFGKPKNFYGEIFTQRPYSEIDDAFDITMEYEKLKVKISSSLMMKDHDLRYAINGSIGSFRKGGLDPQEDQLKAGWWPDMPGFGEEDPSIFGNIKSGFGNLDFEGKINSLPGNWGILIQAIADSLLNNAPFPITEEQILTQMEIMEKVKKIE